MIEPSPTPNTHSVIGFRPSRLSLNWESVCLWPRLSVSVSRWVIQKSRFNSVKPTHRHQTRVQLEQQEHIEQEYSMSHDSWQHFYAFMHCHSVFEVSICTESSHVPLMLHLPLLLFIFVLSSIISCDCTGVLSCVGYRRIGWANVGPLAVLASCRSQISAALLAFDLQSVIREVRFEDLDSRCV